MTKHYKFLEPNVRIHKISKVPLNKGIFLHEPKLKDHWGPKIYQLYCTQGFTVTFDRNEEKDDESLFIDIRGVKKEKHDDIYFGDTYCIVNKSGAYICIYCIESGNVYTSGENIHCLFHAKRLYEREVGDQLAQIFLPEGIHIEEKDNITLIG